MKAKIIKVKGHQKNKVYKDIGIEAFTYKNKQYYTGDIVTIWDRYEMPMDTIVLQKDDRFFIYGFYYSSINGQIDELEIKDILLLKSYEDLEDGEEIVDFRINIDDLDKLEVHKMPEQQLKTRISAEDKFYLLEMQMDLYLPVLKDKTASKERKESASKILHELGKDYQILFDIVQEHKYNEKNKGKSSYLKY